MQQSDEIETERTPGVPLLRLLLTTLWIAVRLLAAYVMAKQVSPFFYQQF